MCCFSPVSAPSPLFARLFRGGRSPPVQVAGTSIFARLEPSGTQLLAYSMKLTAAGEVAMILPLPVDPNGPGAGDDALSFLSLADHPRLFEELDGLFNLPLTADKPKARLRFSMPLRPRLVVHEVGAFEASYVPSRGDFDRLDERFRLPDQVWDRLAGPADAGFAVFRLAPGRAKPIHPMAFRFRTRDRTRLFFPTVHVHDGEVHDRARFDHRLYYQLPVAEPAPPRPLIPQSRTGPYGGQLPSGDLLSISTPSRDYRGLVLPDTPVARRQLTGLLPNRDTWIDLPAAPATSPGTPS